MIQESIFFGLVLSILSFYIAEKIRKRFDYAWCNPLLLASIMIIIFLLVLQIDYEVYAYGARNLSNFLTPVTVCLAVPLYKQLQVLRKNLGAICIGIFCGCMMHACILVAIAMLCNMDPILLRSILSKSVTTAIALGVTKELGGIPEITIVGVTIAGIGGAIIGPKLLHLVGVKEPVAQGLALGAASHAIGTTRAVELGEIQGAMSSLAIVVTGILTAIMLPLLFGSV